MSEYKRFTKKLDSGFVSDLDCRIAYNKLAELEDKIESGKMIELLCRVCDTLYKICPQDRYVKMGEMHDSKIVTRPCQRCPWKYC